MKHTNKLNKLKSIISLATIAFLPFFYTPVIWAGDSGSIGSRVVAGKSSNFTKSCRAEERISGIDISTGGSWEINKLRLNCTRYKDNGDWWVSHSQTSWTNPSSFNLSNSSNLILCPTNTWVGGISSSTGERGISHLRLYCYKGNADGVQTGNASTTRNFAPAGSITVKRDCPNNELAYAVSGKINDGGKVMSMRLKCKAEAAVPSQPRSIPVLISPGSRISREIYPGITEFHFRPVNDATHYKIRIAHINPFRPWFEQIFGGRLLFASGGDDRYVKIRIPENKAGTVMTWSARACNKVGECYIQSQGNTFSVIPKPR